MVSQLRARGYDVHGDLRDLIPSPAPAPTGGPTSGSRPGDIDDAELADAAQAALVAMTEKYARLWWRNRRHDPTEPDTDISRRLTSQLRASSYRLRMTALRLADKNRLVNRAVNAYVRRASRASGE
jgi:hypothetical protein